MAKSIRYGSYCIPQEQVHTGQSTAALNKFHLDGDCGRKLGGGTTLGSIDSFGTLYTVTTTNSFLITYNFMAAKALEIEEGSMVLLSLDSGNSYPIRLLKGECFASKVDSTARMHIQICTATDGSGSDDGVAKVEFWGATI